MLNIDPYFLWAKVLYGKRIQYQHRASHIFLSGTMYKNTSRTLATARSFKVRLGAIPQTDTHQTFLPNFAAIHTNATVGVLVAEQAPPLPRKVVDALQNGSSFHIALTTHHTNDRRCHHEHQIFFLWTLDSYIY